MKKFIIFGLIVSVIGIGASVGITFRPAIDESMPVHTVCSYGLETGCEQIYTDLVSGNVRYQNLDESGVVLVDRLANPEELAIYSAFLDFKLLEIASDSAVSDIEVGKTIVKIAREWSADYAFHAADWDSKTTSQKLVLVREDLDRTGKFYGWLADYLVSVGYSE